MFEKEFLCAGSDQVYRESILRAVEILQAALPSRPYSGKTPTDLAAIIDKEILPDNASSLDQALEKVRPLIANSILLTHPHTIAHFHCPPLIVSLAAEVIISALNQSMDSFDQAPAATMLEMAVCRWLCDEVGLPAGSDAVFTSGATQSNFMGLLLARDTAVASQQNWMVHKRAVPPQVDQLRILCSEAAHFTVEKAACQLGLGSDAVIKVPVDDSFRMIPAALADSLETLWKDELLPAAVVATAGTTDFGSIDPLPEIAALARRAGAWFHVDAAYGSALLLSHRHRDLLRGIEHADSISMDFHKAFWQVISCGAFLVRDDGKFRHLEIHADYLNPKAHDHAGIPNLVNRSLATTRRFDALKLWLSFQVLGRQKFGQMIDRTIELAAEAADLIRANSALELVHQPQSGCVVFRYRPSRQDLDVDVDVLNAALRQRLFDRGLAVIGHTRVRGRQHLKFTFMNPTTKREDIAALITLVVDQGRSLEKE